jgi:plastocyanin
MSTNTFLFLCTLKECTISFKLKNNKSNKEAFMATERRNRRHDDIPPEDHRRRGRYTRRDNYNREDSANPLSLLLALLLLLLIGGLIWWFWAQGQRDDNGNNRQETRFENDVRVEGVNQTFPRHRETLPAAPANIVISANNELSADSSIRVERDGRDYGEGRTRREADNRVIRRNIQSDAPEGYYTVIYSLCERNESCREGRYQFRVDRAEEREFEDKSGERNVTIRIRDGRLDPERVKISSGTRVTWRNESNSSYTLYPGSEDVREYFPNLNSGRIAQNGSFSLVIREEGYMVYYAEDGRRIEGRIIVE